MDTDSDAAGPGGKLPLTVKAALEHVGNLPDSELLVFLKVMGHSGSWRPTASEMVTMLARMTNAEADRFLASVGVEANKLHRTQRRLQRRIAASLKQQLKNSQPKRTSSQETLDRYVEWKELRDRGLSYKRIAMKYGVTEGAVRYGIRKLNAKQRKP